MTLKTTDHLFIPIQALCIIPQPLGGLDLSYSLETDKLGFNLCELDLWPLTLTFCMDIIFVTGNYPWKFHDDTMTET